MYNAVLPRMNHIRFMRKARELTIAELVARAGVHHDTIAQIEGGRMPCQETRNGSQQYSIFNPRIYSRTAMSDNETFTAAQVELVKRSSGFDPAKPLTKQVNEDKTKSRIQELEAKIAGLE